MPDDLNMYSEAVQRSAVHCMGKRRKRALLSADEVRQTDRPVAVGALNRTNEIAIHSVLAAWVAVRRLLQRMLSATLVRNGGRG